MNLWWDFQKVSESSYLPNQLVHVHASRVFLLTMTFSLNHELHFRQPNKDFSSSFMISLFTAVNLLLFNCPPSHWAAGETIHCCIFQCQNKPQFKQAKVNSKTWLANKLWSFGGSVASLSQISKNLTKTCCDMRTETFSLCLPDPIHTFCTTVIQKNAKTILISLVNCWGNINLLNSAWP